VQPETIKGLVAVTFHARDGYEKEHRWISQIADLMLDTCLRNKESGYIKFSTEVVGTLVDIWETQPKGWQAELHHLWAKMIDEGKSLGYRPELDVEGGKWVWVSGRIPNGL
jgi:hypothetical protein